MLDEEIAMEGFTWMFVAPKWNFESLSLHGLAPTIGETSMTTARKTALKRPRQSMPIWIRNALDEHGLLDAYKARPAYQKNDYLAWIKDAKQEATRMKRLDQMLSELRGGKKYMNMAWSDSSKG